MGQKTHPYGLRLGLFPPTRWEEGAPTKSWKSLWFARKDYVNLLQEDIRMRNFLKQHLKQAGISSIEIARSSGRVRIKIFTARPGVLIGRRGSEIDKLRDELRKITKSEIFIDPKEVNVPQIDAQLIAENIASQLERRIHFRRAMKKAITMARTKGADGVRIQCKGRLGGAEIARREQYKEGKLPLGTLRANIDYGFTEAHTTYGSIGIKVWVCHGEILLKKEEHERQAQLAIEREKADQAAREHEEGASGGAFSGKEGAATPELQSASTAGAPKRGQGPVATAHPASIDKKEGQDHAPHA